MGFKALVALAGTVVTADNTLDVVQFQNLVMDYFATKSDMTSIVTLKKQYSYVPGEGIEKLPKILNGRKGMFNAAVELNLEEPTPSEGTEESEERAKEDQYFMNKQVLDDLKMTADDLPSLVLIRKGELVSKMKLNTNDDSGSPPGGEEQEEPKPEGGQTEFSEIADWLGTNGIDVEDDSETYFPAFSDVLEKFAAAAKEKYGDVLKEAEKVAADAEDKEKSAIYMRVLKNAAKNGDAEKYLGKELERVKGLLATNAVAAKKKFEMTIKLKCMKALMKKMTRSDASKDEI